MANVTRSPDLIFAEAIEIESPGERRSFLEQACHGDDELLRAVARLVADHFRAGSFLESPAADLAAVAGLKLVPECPGTVIGPYKLLEQIGEGGFGVVYMAEQTQPVKRKVALKVIKPGMDTRQVVARFEVERQALALMDHPNIAKVLDAGTTGFVVPYSDGDRNPEDRLKAELRTGRPYFVMELVYGVPITAFCDAQRLAQSERLRLFIDVCRAVQHAHQKGVIHRDLKPSNVMVSRRGDHDDRAVPKVIDFGVSKAINQQLTEKTLFTGYGQMIGTPTYMSPEQTQLSGLDVDTRSDVYSLGVLLYELITGTTPFEEATLKQAGFDEMRRMIREVEPPCPSERVSTLQNVLLSTVADERQVDPRKLSQSLRGELDWIVMKCLEKDRNRRYDTASSLTRDIERYLRDEPVQACPPSAAYRLQKFARRNRAVLISGGLVAAALVVSTAISISQAFRATRAESLATARLKQATEARANAESNSQNARLAVDDMYTQVAEKWLAHQPQMGSLQREFLDKALQFYTGFAKESSNDPSVRFETARAYRRIAEILHRLGEPAKAEDAFHQAANHLQSLVDEFPSVAEHRAELAAVLHKQGVLLGDTGRSAEEEKVHRRGLALEQKLLAEYPDTAAYRRDVGRGHWFLGQALLALQRWEEAEKELRSALATQSSLVREFPTNSEYRQHLAQTYLRLGLTLRSLNRLDEFHRSLTESAEILEALVSDYPTLPDYRNELANVYYWHVDDNNQRLNLPLDRAEQYLKRAIEIQSQLAADYPSVTDYRYDWFRSQKTLGRALMQAGRYEEAETALRQAATTAENLTAHAPTVQYYRGGLAYTIILRARLLAITGRHADAEAAYREAIRLLKALVAEVPTAQQYRHELQKTYDELESALIAAGRTEEAAEIRRDAMSHTPAPSASHAHADRPPDTESDADESLTIPESASPPTTDH